MARYDQWGPRGGAGNFREMDRQGPWRGGGPSGEMQRPRGRSGYDPDFAQGGGRSRGQGGGAEWQGMAGGVYGPARYGLGPYYQRLLDRRRPDDELQEEVEEALFYDSWVDAEAIKVTVEDGVVTLSGELPSFEEVRYAIDDAWDVDGVRGVRSELNLRSGEEQQ